MPLDADDGGIVGGLNSLDDLVQIPAGAVQGVGGPFHGLMVQAVDAELGLAGDVGESGIGFEPDLFCRQQPGAVVGKTANMADIIVKGAAEDGVDQLRTAAYANHGDAVFQRVPNPFDFQCVSFRIELDPGIDFTTVMLRADVVTATDHQCIRRRPLPRMINRNALRNSTAQA